MHLKELFRCKDGQIGEFQFSAFEIIDVAGDQRLSSAGDSKFEQVVVAFIGKVWPP